MAENYISDAEAILREAEAAKRRRLHHRAIRLSQESFELSLKAVLRAVGIEYPKEHEVSDVLKENAGKFPGWLQTRLGRAEEASIWLSQRRGPSMYGDEIAGKPASQLFSSNDSARALEFARDALRLGKKLLREIFVAERGFQ